MSNFERAQQYPAMPEPDMEELIGSFDIDAAFQEAVTGIANDDELALDEKVRRMEVIVREGTSDVYRDFVNFRQIAAQMEMMCNHDHAFRQSMETSDTLTSFMSGHKYGDGHERGEASQYGKDYDEYETDPITGKRRKKKKRWSWFGA